ncbi:MAG: serine hydrolase domain-containing protein [Chitinophagales bacterium]
MQKLIDNILEKVEPNKKPTFGLVIGIIDGQTTYEYAYGQLSEKNNTKPNQNTVFQIGSISKVFTSTILMGMVQDSIVQLHDAITDFLPDSLAQQNPWLQNITLAQLVTHTSGLPKTPYNISMTIIDKENPYANYQIQDLYRFLGTYRPIVVKKKKKHTPFAYSNLGMGLLGHLLENAAASSFDSLLYEYINAPLKLENTSLSLSKKQQEKLAIGHYFSGRTINELTYKTLYSSEGLYSSLNDMIKFIKANLFIDNPNNIFELTHTPLYDTQMRWVKMAYGWFVISKDRKKMPTVITHSGRTGGYSNYIAFDKERQIGIVVMSNSAHRIDDIGIEIFEILIQNR